MKNNINMKATNIKEINLCKKYIIMQQLNKYSIIPHTDPTCKLDRVMNAAHQRIRRNICSGSDIPS